MKHPPQIANHDIVDGQVVRNLTTEIILFSCTYVPTAQTLHGLRSGGIAFSHAEVKPLALLGSL